jgi:integrase
MIIRVKGVKKIRAKGHLYFYHRKTMTRLPGQPGSTEFMAALHALDRKQELDARPGTLGALIEKYRRSPEFTEVIAKTTRSVYQEVFDYLKPLRGMQLNKIDSAFLYQVRDKAVAKKKRHFANMTITVLRLLFTWGMKRDHLDRNPALAVDPIKKPKNAKIVNRPWRIEELDTVLAEAPPRLLVPIAIAAYAGLRECDAVKVTWHSYDGTSFETRQQKTGIPMWVKAHYRLREILDATPRVSPNIVVSTLGRPYTEEVLRAQFFPFIRRLVAEGKVQPGLSFHGLRHTLGTLLAEAGCDTATIAAVLGQESTKMAEHYSKTAHRHHLAGAGIERMEERDRNRNRKTGRKTDL